MGFFSRKKKEATPVTPSSPLIPAPPSPVIVQEAPRPSLRLRIALDPLPLSSQSNDSFCIDVGLDADVNELRRAVQRRLGISTGVALYKVAIPVLAIEQSREYTDRYSRRVDLVNIFPAFSLDDTTQLPSSLGASGWQMTLPPRPTIRDWFPLPADSHAVISILARPCSTCPPTVAPLTLISHFAPAESSRPSSSRTRSGTSAASSPSPVSKPLRQPPIVVDIAPSASVKDLKSAILSAGKREELSLEQVVLWKVEMSETEMIVIEERGGLKGGQMPWPYPPTAEVPVKLEAETGIDKYWNTSNTRMVSLSVWTATGAFTPSSPDTTPTEEVPIFTYPMSFPLEPRRVSASHSLPNRSPNPDIIISVASPQLDSASTLPFGARSARRGRPNTAPAAVDTSTTGTHAFGARRLRSPLAPSAPTMGDQSVKGLGIVSPDAHAHPAGDLEVDMSNLRLDVSMGHGAQEGGAGGLSQQNKVIWYQSEGRPSVKRTESARTIRSFAHNKALRAYEVA